MRTNGLSSLDFTYWILESVEENYQAIDTDDIYSAADDGSLMQTLVVDCALVCGVEVPRDFDALMAKVSRYEASRAPEEAMGIRGALLYRNGDLTLSVGDEKRLVGVDTNGAISLYRMRASDRDPDYWDGALLLPEMRYL